MFTRRCTQRQFLLRPDREMNKAVAYCVGAAAEEYGIELYSVMAMSNHLAITCHDARGEYPLFLQYLHSLLARCGNVIRSRWEGFWSTDKPNKLELLDAAAVLDKIVYNVTDAVRQNLVDKVNNWPGVCSLRYQLMGKPMVAKRPSKFFREDGDMPQEVALHFKKPREFAHLSDEEWTKLLADRVSALERRAAAEREAKGTRITGRKAILRRSPTSSPTTTPPRRNLNPKVASRDKNLREAALERIKVFEQNYREALKKVADGAADVLFPYGTYKLARLRLVKTKPAPS